MRLTERVRKTDWLNELRALVIAGIALIVFVSVVEVIMVAFGGEVVAELPGDAAGSAEFQVGGQAMRSMSTEVLIVDPTPAQALWYLAARLPSLTVVLAALLMLLRLLSRARRANPFSRDTVRHLRWLATVVGVGGTLAGLVEFVASTGISSGLDTGRISGHWNFPLLWLFAGFGVMAVAEIVARGCAMREELDEVV